MSYKTFKDLVIESPWDLIEIKNVEIKIKPNQHAICTFGAVIAQDDYVKIQENMSEKSIKVSICENGAWNTEFYGCIDNIKVKSDGEYCILKVKSSSFTKKLDLLKNSRSFQDVKMSYDNLVSEVLKNFGNGTYIFNIAGNKKTEMPVIQYDETDWDFLKRMASNCGSVIVPDISCNKPRFWFGMPEGKNNKINDYEISENGYTNLSGGNNSSSYKYYVVKSAESYKIGDKIELNNTEVVIYEKHGKLEKGLFVYCYKLVSEDAISKKRICNQKICGMSIIGKVIDTAGQKLKVHLDIDKNQDKDKAYWYDYTPQTGNSMYCMPKIGTNVSVYFRDDKEEHARAVSCVRNNGATCPKMSDSNNRSFTTEHNKEMNLLPEQIDFTGGTEGNPYKITLDNNTIKFTSDKSLVMSADTDVTFKAGKNITLNAEGCIGIFIGNGESTPNTGIITIDMEINILGQNVFIKGSEEVSLESVEGPLKRREVDAGGLFKNILIGIGIACVVAALAAVALPAVAAAAGVATLSGTAIFATVAVGGSIPVLIQAGKDFHNGTNSPWEKYAQLGGIYAFGTAIALLPIGGILGKAGLSNKIAQTMLGSGVIAGGGSTFIVDNVNSVLNGEQYNLKKDFPNICLGIVFNMIPDLAEAVRANKEAESKATGAIIKETVNSGEAKSVKALYEIYGLKATHANINLLKSAIRDNPKEWIKYVVKDSELAEKIMSNPKLKTEILENTLPLLGPNGISERKSIGEFLFGKYETESY